jgi:hypothetical protein
MRPPLDWAYCFEWYATQNRVTRTSRVEGFTSTLRFLNDRVEWLQATATAGVQPP